MSFFDPETPRRAKIYIVCTLVVGSSVLCHSLYYSLTATDFRWLYLACLTALSTVTISDVFLFTAILLFGPEVAVTIGAIETVTVTKISFISKRMYKILFNLTQLSIVTFIVGKIFYNLRDSNPPLNPENINVLELFIQLGLCALLYFILNTMAVATAIGLTTNRKIFRIWKNDFLWLSLPTFAGASAAAIIFIYFEQTPFFAVAVAAPVVLVIYYAYKLNLQRINQAQQHVVQLNDLYHSTIESLAMAIDAKDAKTHGHIQRVQTLALRLADHFGVKDENELEGLRAASLLHDIGKLAIPEYILNKPSPLTKWEEEKVRKHPNIGADILSSVPFPYPVIPFVRYHHERWDGTGYPDGLSGEEIPLGARILSIADCYDALRSERPYRPQLSKEVAVEHIKSESGRSYDPKIVRTLEQHVDDLELAMKAAENELAATTAETHRELETTYEGQEGKAIGSTVFHEIASTHKEIQALYEISRALGRSLRVSDTLSILAEKIRKLVPYSSCAVYLVDSQKGTLDPYYVLPVCIRNCWRTCNSEWGRASRDGSPPTSNIWSTSRRPPTSWARKFCTRPTGPVCSCR